MKTPSYVRATRLAAAMAIALAGSSLAVPALAEAGSAEPAVMATPSPAPSAEQTPAPIASGSPSATPTATPTATPAPVSSPATPAISDAGLAEAALRDLGMTLEQFNAAGELAKRAADAVPSLQGLPGYVGISLKNGKIVVEGSGAELQERVDQLNAARPTADFVLAPTPAVVSPQAPAELTASDTDRLFEAYIREVGPAGLQAVAYADGHFIIRTGGTTVAESSSLEALKPVVPSATSQPPAPGKISPAEFVARYKNVELEHGAPVKTERDIFGGQGYVLPGGGACSVGFSAFSPAGEPEVLTAGHCAGDGVTKEASVEDPASSPAAGAPQGGPAVAAGALGTFGFSQFGGPGNTALTGTAADPGNVGTDIAVIKGLASGIITQPAAAKWDDATNPAPTAVKIIGTTAPFPGQAVCRSGRTTGWKCGTVASVGIWAMPGSNNDLRAVRAFDSTTVTSDGGDSGGPWISGNFGVGTHTGAETQGYGAGRIQLRAIAATLVDAMKQLPGVQLQLFLNKPQLAGTQSADTVAPGSVIHGQVAAAPASAVAADSRVRLVRSSQGKVQDTVEIPVDKAGNWSFQAPAKEGPFQFTAETVNGYSRSVTATFSLSVSELTPPTISTPAAGSSLPALASIEGTGTPGNVVKLSGDASGSASVTADGRWSVSLGNPALYGRLSVSAVQTSPGHVDSAPATVEVLVPPPAPTVTTSLAGLSFSQGSVPQSISGTGVDGAEVTVLMDGAPVGSAQSGAGIGARAVVGSLVPRASVSGGRWSVPFPGRLGAGAHTLSVTQSVDGITSLPAVSTFSISAPAAAAAAAAAAATAPPAAGPAATAAAAAAPAAGPTIQPKALNQPGSPALLASTGAGGVLSTAGLAAGALLLGGLLIALGRRRRAAE